MVRILHLFIFSTLVFSNYLANAQNKLNNDSIEHIVFLIGDAGEAQNKSAEVFNAFLKQVKPIENKSTIIFLGDNIYPGGMPNKTEDGREEAEDIILYQLNRLKQSKAKTYYIPGNHDWNKGQKDGLSHLLNEEQFIEQNLNNENEFIPSNGCPGPFKINVSDHLVLIAIDTQWWLHKFEKGNCNNISTTEIISNLRTLLNNNKDKNILIIGHHPLKSKGDHGGFFTLKSHLFPLTHFNKYLYLPLPIIGSIVPFYRKFIGNKQDIAHSLYKKMIAELTSVFKEFDNLIYAAGHEHNLQYYNQENRHYIVSGSGCKNGDVKKLKPPNFSANKKGYFKLCYLKNSNVFLQTFGIVNGSEKLLFQKMIPRFEKNITTHNLTPTNHVRISH